MREFLFNEKFLMYRTTSLSFLVRVTFCCLGTTRTGPFLVRWKSNIFGAGVFGVNKFVNLC